MKQFSTYKEMFDFMMSKGVKVDFSCSRSCYGHEAAPDQEYLPCWMIRTDDSDNGKYYFAAGMDLNGNGEVWISGRTFKADESIIDNINKTLGEIYSYRKPFRPDQILICVDQDVYYPRD